MTLDDEAKRRLVARSSASDERAIVVRVEGHIRDWTVDGASAFHLKCGCGGAGRMAKIAMAAIDDQELSHAHQLYHPNDGDPARLRWIGGDFAE
jgi:hypothetical protein